MKTIKKSKIIVCCKGCKSVLEIEHGDIIICGITNNNTKINCSLCGTENMITIDGKITSNVEITI